MATLLSPAGTEGSGGDALPFEVFKDGASRLESVLPRDGSRDVGLAGLLWNLGIRGGSARKLLRTVLKTRGALSSYGFERWLNQRLAEEMEAQEIELSDPSGQVRFEDLRLPLKVIAADIEGSRVVVFSESSTPDVPVVEAVGASISVPLVFQPRTIHSQTYGSTTCVDGGLVSNYPVWVFDEEREASGLSIPTLGFRLLQTPTEGLDHESIQTFGSFLSSLIDATTSGMVPVHERHVDRLHPVEIDTGNHTSLKFDLTRADADQLWYFGRGAARLAILERFPSKIDLERAREDIDAMLMELLEAVREECEGFATQRPDIDARPPPQEGFRANVFMISSRGSTEVSYGANMAGHDDESLELPLFGGSTGTCFSYQAPVITPLYLSADHSGDTTTTASAGETPTLSPRNLTVDMEKRVWDRLQLILSVPILDARDQNLALGVLNIDSSATLRDVPFYIPRLLRPVQLTAAWISRYFDRERLMLAKRSVKPLRRDWDFSDVEERHEVPRRLWEDHEDHQRLKQEEWVRLRNGCYLERSSLTRRGDEVGPGREAFYFTYRNMRKHPAKIARIMSRLEPVEQP